MSFRDHVPRRTSQPTPEAPVSVAIEGAETPALLATSINPDLLRTDLWRLFDRVACALRDDIIDNVIIGIPPQVGKSEYWSRFFPAWWIENHRTHRVVLASYNASFAGRFGRRTRDTIIRNPKLFGIRVRPDVQARNEWEVEGHEGGMVSAGVDGAVSGRPAELVIADDLVSDVTAAYSAVEREKCWSWVEEELFARCQRRAKRIIVMTRRHPSDVVGRLLEIANHGKEHWHSFILPALATDDEHLRAWGWQRRSGESVCPERFTTEDFERIRDARGPHVWSGLYQQEPTLRGGGMFRRDWFRTVEADPGYTSAVRAWDLAGSEGAKSCQTVGLLMTSRREDGVLKFHITDVVAGKWAPGERDRVIVETAQRDGKGVAIVLEQEPGSGGIAQANAIISKLPGWRAHSERATGSKAVRADPLAASAGVGNVTLRRAPWTEEFWSEVDGFPDAKAKDMVDAAAHAFNWLAERGDNSVAVVSNYLCKGPRVPSHVTSPIFGSTPLMPFRGSR